MSLVDNAAALEVVFKKAGQGGKDEDFNPIRKFLQLRPYGNDIIRISLSSSPDPRQETASPMLEMREFANCQLKPAEENGIQGFEDLGGRPRVIIRKEEFDYKQWRDDWPPKEVNSLGLDLYPDGETKVSFLPYDYFLPHLLFSVPLGLTMRGDEAAGCTFAFRCDPDESFCGTGERFSRINLAGRTVDLRNADALGVNTPDCYKNIPFYLSSKGYGLFLHTSSYSRFSFGDVSHSAVMGYSEDPELDLFIIGGGCPEKVLYNYRCLTGFPPELPVWSYGVWMSRLSYFSADEVTSVCQRMRENKIPLDVIHLDTGWFDKEWVCDWEFSKDRFPDSGNWIKSLLEMGIRLSVWQKPALHKSIPLWDHALQKGYIAPNREESADKSDFSTGSSGIIDFSNEEAVAWYQGLLAKLIKGGCSVIKADFGESIDLDARYKEMSADKLHNLYALLYQRAAFTEVARQTGEGIIWARGGWAGCQRYPVHWSGDANCTWTAMAFALRGALHFGLSGGGYWSSDTAGFMNLPEPNCLWPSNDLYIRWTQFSTFTSHFRYHGTQPREPYLYPDITDIVREWLLLRYALIPYIRKEGRKMLSTGKSMVRALLVEFPDDRTCWQIDDAYMFGDSFLVAPFLNEKGKRDVYLPEGDWIDFWSGERHAGPVWLKDVTLGLNRLPLYVRSGHTIRIYPEKVYHTGEMHEDRICSLAFDSGYKGFAKSLLGKVAAL